jgi:hypothetical protein
MKRELERTSLRAPRIQVAFVIASEAKQSRNQWRPTALDRRVASRQPARGFARRSGETFAGAAARHWGRLREGAKSYAKGAPIL